MILILLYWCYLLFLSATLGVLFQKCSNLPQYRPEITLFLGGFAITLLGSIWGIFSGLGFLFEIILIGLALFTTIAYYRDIRQYFISLKAKITTLSPLLKIGLLIISVFALAQSATAPYMIDNETYYIQTIKWLDAYGFVPGLANLHFFLSQLSGWHIFQSATNLDMLFPHFNDLSGFYLLIANLYALSHLQHYFEIRKWIYLAIGLFPLGNVFLFQFIGAPSPDIGVYTCFLIIFGEFLKYDGQSKTQLHLIFILAVFACYIKLTAVLFLVFPLYLWYRSPYSLKNMAGIWGTLGGLSFVLFLLKNTMITGYPFYPITAIGDFVHWQLPATVQDFYQEQTKLHGFFMTPEIYASSSPLERFIRWISLPKLHGLFNMGMCILLVIAPFVIKRATAQPKRLWVVYIVSLVQLVLLLLSSPQYRYFFMFFTALSVIIGALWFQKRSLLIKSGFVISTLVIAIPLFFPLNLNSLTQNEFHLSLSRFSPEYSVTPHPKTRYVNATYRSTTLDSLEVFTPENVDFFWATGDGPLPCVQEQQLLYFSNYLHIVPQPRGPSLKDGFFSKPVIDE